ncbi:hypothetical protein SH1V18_18960 [Vallitalea longa]|uniref:Uncharacterized protein n=1 Tax=Vallitalea longa TaxID=2936439 RepID=A0A9W6DDV2_9FIRM|nr:hypothetical protein [Vallitalea longa]GKX29416.1 hypothetical protein SH1V18_18960 [Vallitalea longa]
MKKLIALLLIVTMSIGMTACSGGKANQKTDAGVGNKEASKENDKLELAESLDLNIALGNNQRTITYQQAVPLTMPDGSIITQGDLKPVWKYIQEQIGVDLKDVAVQDQKAVEMIEVSAATGFTDATVYGGDNIAEQFMSYGAQGYFVNLKERLNDMPNFSKYLEENPNVAKAITAYDGGIYHVPYTAEIGSYARIFAGRETWVIELLDRKESLIDESHTLDVHYKGYWDRNETNVIDLQNEACNNDKLTRDVALNTLSDYISNTYPDLEKPSDLYLGKTAEYDIDELVALLRVIELSPNTLSKISTGEVVEDAQISPIFFRKTKYREDLLRFANYFDGQRVFGSDSYKARFYLDENGEFNFSYAEDEFLKIVDYLKDMYSEGLIYSEFADLSMKDEIRKPMYSKDDEEGHKQFGFMTNDWIQSTTASNDDIVGMLPPITKIGSNEEFVHYVENTRAIKLGGWAISTASDEKQINAALKLFDYMFTEEGHIVQNYGIPDVLAEGETFVAPNGTEYPKFNDWLINTSNDMKNGDVSGFLRDYMGSLIPIGYQKEIGFELQLTNEKGWDAWDLYESAGVLSTSYDSEDPLFKLVPPVYSLTEQDTAKLGTLSIGDIQTEQIFMYITNGDNAVESVKELKQLYIDGGVEEYIKVYQGAYDRSNK